MQSNISESTMFFLIANSSLPFDESGPLLKRNGGCRENQTLFIDSLKMGVMVDRTKRDFLDKDISQISSCYKNWKTGQSYDDIPGFCKSVTSDEIRAHNYALVPGRYVGFKKDYINKFSKELIKQEVREIEQRIEQINSSAKKSLTILNKLWQSHI